MKGQEKNANLTSSLSRQKSYSHAIGKKLGENSLM